MQKLVITFALVALVLTGCEDKLGGGGSRFDGTNGHVVIHASPVPYVPWF